MKYKFLSMSFLLLCSFKLFAQNPAVILAPKYYTDAFGYIDLPKPGPINTDPLDGYDGQKALHAQNIQLNREGKIMFFIVDEHIYDRKGNFLDKIYNENFDVDATGYMSEIVVVPMPNETTCTVKYYIFSSFPDNGITIAKATYSVLSIEYDSFDNPITGSGLENLSFDPTLAETFLNLSDFAGSDYLEYNNLHDENASIAAIKRGNLNEYFAFVLNGRKLNRFLINSEGTLSYEGNIFIDPVFDPNYSFIPHDFNKKELEVIRLANGNYRVAMCMIGTNNILGQVGAVSGVYIIDLDQNANFIVGSNRFVEYRDINGSTDDLLVKGIEFSPSGQRLYVSHTKTALYNNVLDMFDLSVNPPAKTILDFPNVNEDDYEFSQLESGLPTIATNPATGTILIPANNRLSRLKNADNPNLAIDFESNYQAITSYLPVTEVIGNEVVTVRLLQDQLDGFNYSSVSSVEYDQYSYTATQTAATWMQNTSTSSNNNPLTTRFTDNKVYIKNELRIPAGKIITIKNMRFEFAPGARVVVERGVDGLTGGKLILDNTTFTADSRCLDDMWNGVIVEGYSNQAQSLTNTVQASFFVENNSLIEYAYEGAFSQNGGILRVSNSKFLNNHSGTRIENYVPQTGVGNLCRILKTDFIWDNEIRNINQIKTFVHLFLSNTRSISLIDNNFNNDISNGIPLLYLQGFGILAFNSHFMAHSDCFNFGTPNCPPQNKNRFKNLNIGAYVINLFGHSFTIDYAEFDNCRVGVHTVFSKNQRITRNHFKIRETNISGDLGNQNCGILLDQSTGYKVEENYLTHNDDHAIPLATAQTYGIVIKNSGEEANQIYKNLFENLKIGSQAEGINGQQNCNREESSLVTSTPSYCIGLQWLCNRFLRNINQHDLVVVNGVVDKNQGRNTAGTSARNQFSLDNEGNEHDFKIVNSRDIHYFHLSGLRQKPDAYTVSSLHGSLILHQITNGSNNVFYNNTYCPSSFMEPGPTPRERRESLGQLVVGLTSKLNNGDADALLELIRTHNNLEELKPILLENSPYLSDRMLNALVERNPSVSMLKDVLIANSSLQKPIIERVNQLSLPNGTKQQIALAQKGINPREELINEISYYENEITKLSYEIINEIQQSEHYQETELMNELINSPRISDKKHLLEIYTKNENIEKISEISNFLLENGVSQDYLELVRLRKEMNNFTFDEAFNVIPDLQTNLSFIYLNSEDEEAKQIAKILLDLKEYKVNIKPFTEVEPQRSGSVAPGKEETSILFNATLATIYPNPTTGQFFIDLPNEEEGTLKVEIFDVTGKSVYVNEFEQTNGERIDLKDAVKGMYLVKITLDNNLIEVQKLELK
jgi:hypothetical protein